MFGVYQCGRGSIPSGPVVVKRGNGWRRRFEAWGGVRGARSCCWRNRPLSTRARPLPRWMRPCRQLTRGPYWPFWAAAQKCPPGGGEPLVGSGEHLLPLWRRGSLEPSRRTTGSLGLQLQRPPASPLSAGLGAAGRGPLRGAAFVAGSRAALGATFRRSKVYLPSSAQPPWQRGGNAPVYVWGTPPPLGNHVQIAGFVC